MERKRVFEIKKRFEELNKTKAVTNGNSQVQLANYSYNAKNGTIAQTFHKEVCRKPELPVKNIVFRRTNSSSSSVEGQNSGKIKRTPAFRSKNDLCKVKIGSSQSKNDLDSPLPKGPAPRKPPRTFAHRVGGEISEMPSLPSCSGHETKMTDYDEKNNNKTTFKRSKTEPLIMLKKIETALKIHQASGNRMKEPPPPPPTNGNEYDEPFDDRKTTSLQITPEKTQQVQVVPAKPFRSSLSPMRSPEPVYSEPCITKTKSPPGLTSPKSLYYLSSPIVDRDGNPRLPRNPAYEEALKKLQMLVVEPSAPPQSELDSDAESVKDVKPEVVEERKIYARRVSSLRERSVSLREVRTQRLMDALILVGIDNDLGNRKIAYIKSKYPINADIPDNIACFIFPDAENWPPAIHPPLHIAAQNSNNYTLVLTSAEGTRFYAYCRRLQPEGSSICLPLAYAIISAHKAASFYYKVLEEVENNHGLSEQNFKKFVQDLYNTDFPKECQTIRVRELTLKRVMDSNQSSNEIAKLLKAITVPYFIQLISNVLLEKKIIILSSYISLLSDSIQGILKSIYPLEWQHTLITVVPSTMFEILQSPIPYILGIMKNESTPISANFFKNLDDAFVIDLDKGQIIANTDPSGPVIPDKLARSLSVALYHTSTNCSDVGPSEALIRLFVHLIGHYRNHLVTSLDSYPNPVREFQREGFIRAPSSKSIRRFLEWFSLTTMFQVFIDEQKYRTNPTETLLFEQRCAEYVEENAVKMSNTLNKAVNNIGDIFKDWRS